MWTREGVKGIYNVFVNIFYYKQTTKNFHDPLKEAVWCRSLSLRLKKSALIYDNNSVHKYKSTSLQKGPLVIY